LRSHQFPVERLAEADREPESQGFGSNPDGHVSTRDSSAD